MKYWNKKTGVEISLGDLNTEERHFYQRAVAHLKSGINWLSFDEFAFGPASPIYKGKKKPKEIVVDPLYLALKDMSLQLGMDQGRIKRSSGSPKSAERSERVGQRVAAAGRRS